MGGIEDNQSAVDQKEKHKIITSVWRPVCTRAISKEGWLSAGMKGRRFFLVLFPYFLFFL